MTTDFFEFTSEKIDQLNVNEKKIFNYVVKNIHDVKNMSIRALAHECYVSTTTMFRFVRKLGFDGYGDFLNMLRLTDFTMPESQIPEVLWQKKYMESYIKNISESLRVIPEERMDQFYSYLDKNPHIYLMARGLSSRIAEYTRHLFTVLGFTVSFPYEDYEIKAALNQITEDDLILAISFSGQNKVVVDTIERIFANKRPVLISITNSSNNIIQNLSDMNFYMFADEISYAGEDITSRTSMMAIIEILAYGWLIREKCISKNKS